MLTYFTIYFINFKLSWTLNITRKKYGRLSVCNISRQCVRYFNIYQYYINNIVIHVCSVILKNVHYAIGNCVGFIELCIC